MLHTLTNHTYWVNSIDVSPNDTKFISASEDHTIKMWNETNGNELMTITGHKKPIYTIRYSPDGTKIASGGCKELKLWTSVGKLIKPFEIDKVIYSLCFSPDSTKIITGYLNNGDIDMWDLELSKINKTF